MTYVVGELSGNSPHNFTTGARQFEQAPRVDRQPPTLGCATTASLPATQGQRSKGEDESWQISAGYQR